MATAISADPTGIAVSGNHIYTTSSGPSTNVVVYNATTGAIINSDLITGLSNPAGIAVVGPVITSQPASVAAPSGGTATFNAAASGTGAITFQWYFNGTALTDGTNIAGRPTATLVLSDLQSSENGTFTVVASDSIGGTTSVTATLSGAGSATFTQEPASFTIASGGSAYSTTQVSGTGSLSYQWALNGTAIPGATSSSLLLAKLTAAGQYTCVVTDSTGQSLNAIATVNVGGASTSELLNLSLRGDTQSGANQLIAGFTIGGSSGQEKLLLRGVGPELAKFLVPDPLADPLLDLYNITKNGNILQNSVAGTSLVNLLELLAAEIQTGAFDLSLNSLSSPLITSLSPGSYSINITGNAGDAGNALAEIYDDSPSFSGNSSLLVNLSGRGYVSSSAGPLYAGFVIGGTSSATVLIRGVGPALANFGISQPLTACSLTVHTVINGVDTILASNSGWNSDPTLSQAFNDVYAFGLAPASLDSAVLLTLPPGAYTAILNSANGQSGVGLVEIYTLP
ncbi:MAG TPA: immunoglobulin domain-containing protein [Opitutaceae bacterium]|jgi:hypothetical protein